MEIVFRRSIWNIHLYCICTEREVRGRGSIPVEKVVTEAGISLTLISKIKL